jgi:hypothetical protein
VHRQCTDQEVTVADERNPTDRDETLDPEDVNSTPAEPARSAGESDPADDIPVPIAMSPAEVDERAQAVEAVRGSTPSRPLDNATADDQRV